MIVEKRLADGVKALQKRLDAASSEEERKYCEFKMREAEIRHAVTTDINKVSKLLDEQENLFDELEAQLTRMKRGVYMNLFIHLFQSCLIFETDLVFYQTTLTRNRMVEFMQTMAL